MHPARTVKRAVTPKTIKKAQRALHPIDITAYQVERSLASKGSVRPNKLAYRHAGCTVDHRTAEAAAKVDLRAGVRVRVRGHSYIPRARTSCTRCVRRNCRWSG